METASLRIKFTPHLQNIHENDSKCCLEIVPEVTCIQNIDKIEWKQENDLIEYSIPITYNIIIRKNKQKMKDFKKTADILDKTYHSCVDLLIPSSPSSSDLGSGDISRIISDTFILSKVTPDVQSNINLMNDITTIGRYNTLALNINQKAENIFSNRKDVFFSTNHLTHHSKCMNHFCNTIGEKSEDHQVLGEVNSESKITITEIVNERLDKITSTESTTVCCVAQVTSIDTINSTSKSTSCENKLKLSITPICSINTVDNPIETVKVVTSNSNICRIYASKKDVQMTASVSTYSNLSNEHIYNVTNATNDNTCKVLVKRLDDKITGRVLPATRVAHFKKLMEKEISPLQLMLNDILHKCSSLGITFKQNTIHKPLCKTKQSRAITNREKQNVSTYCWRQKEPKSNRVVYSIVFDN